MTDSEELRILRTIVANLLRGVTVDMLKAELARREGEPERKGFKRVKLKGTH